ncbi:helicase [Nitzschia inconspicua]|uniref:Helicase n=1 Tax=Nitzschia inconspicua TaxID=303405 RepID=A0A9K3PNP7_9STRA|nr:helicase [Nitzschia inconspicua]
MQSVSLPPLQNDATDKNSALERLLKQLRPFQREAYDFATKGIVNTRQDESSGSASDIKRKTNSPVVYDPKLMGQGRLLLADEPGLGKSATSLAIMTHYREEWPLLILCPSSLRFTWPGEIEKFLPELSPSAVYVVQGFDDADFYENEWKRKRIKIVVASYSLLQKRSAAARVLQEFKFKCVIADESHNLKQKSSQRTQLALPLLQNAKRLMLLSGTPALARPVELWTQVYALAPDLFGNYSTFTKKYCGARHGRFGWDVSGMSNADELHSKLRQIMVRRLKADVLDELPAKQRSVIPIAISKSKRKECEALMKELKETRQSVADLIGDEAYGANFEARRLMMQAYQSSGVAKAEGVCDYLLEWIRGSGTQKVLIFAHHKAVLDAIENTVAKELKGGGHIRIDGTVSSQERALRVKKFQTCGGVKVGILSMTAAGVGLTLTAASTVMFAELHWTPGVLAQAEDRCHRISQKNSVNVMYLVCDDSNLSIDMQLWHMLGRKINKLGRVVDGAQDAGLDVQKATVDSRRIQESKNTVSEQEELQTFFANSALNDDKKSSKSPVKGTIMSFFAKQKSAQKAPRSPIEVIEVDKSKTTPSFETIIWDCKVCTFNNSQRMKKATGMICEMCGSPHAQDVFVVDLTSPETSHAPHQVTPRQTEKKKQSSIICVSDDVRSLGPTENLLFCTNGHSKKRKFVHQPLHQKDLPNQSTALAFAVSKNSGRVTIHYFHTGESSLVNFEIDQVVDEETVDKMMQAKLARSNEGCVSLQPVYDELAIRNVLEKIDGSKIDPDHDFSSLASELKQFVTQYVGLREIEKKILKESGRPYPCFNLKQAILRDAPPSAQNSTTRYTGGAKERARERQGLGHANDTDMAVLQGRLCAYCGGDLPRASLAPGVQATYCSKDCTENGRLKRGGMFSSSRVREQVFALEGGVCGLCGINAHALYTRIIALQPAERLNALCNANWRLPKSAKALDRLLLDPKEGDFWNADHINAVAEGGGGCNLDNLRTLCVPCHAGETQTLSKRLKLSGGSKANTLSDTHRQIDIRSMLGAASSNNN